MSFSFDFYFSLRILVAVNSPENPEDPAGGPPNLALLEILTDFTAKLLKQDKKVVLGYLDKRVAGGVPNSRGMTGLLSTCIETAWCMGKGIREGVVQDIRPRSSITGRGAGLGLIRMMTLMVSISE